MEHRRKYERLHEEKELKRKMLVMFFWLCNVLWPVQVFTSFTTHFLFFRKEAKKRKEAAEKAVSSLHKIATLAKKAVKELFCFVFSFLN